MHLYKKHQNWCNMDFNSKVFSREATFSEAVAIRVAVELNAIAAKGLSCAGIIRTALWSKNNKENSWKDRQRKYANKLQVWTAAL